MAAPGFRSILLVLILALVAGCGSVLDPWRWERVVGVILVDDGFPSAPLQVPASVRQGVPFTATVTTHGSGSCLRADGAEVVVTGLTARITPYDQRRTGNVACTDDLAPYPRTVTLRFDTAGEATIQVIGRALVSDAPREYTTTLTVEP